MIHNNLKKKLYSFKRIPVFHTIVENKTSQENCIISVRGKQRALCRHGANEYAKLMGDKELYVGAIRCPTGNFTLFHNTHFTNYFEVEALGHSGANIFDIQERWKKHDARKISHLNHMNNMLLYKYSEVNTIEELNSQFL